MARCARRSSGATGTCATGEVPAPDVLLIDGGLGQISQVHEVLAELGFADLDAGGCRQGTGATRRPGAAVRVRDRRRR